MDACLAVEREVDKVMSKFENIRDSYADEIQSLIDQLEAVQKNLETESPEESKLLVILLGGT